MIKAIYSGGRYVQVNNGQPGTNYVQTGGSQSSGSQSFAGQLRYGANNQTIEVFDGNVWVALGSGVAQVGLDPLAEEALDWVRKKMQEEKDMYERMKRHPGLKEAYERFRIMDTLTAEHEYGSEAEGMQVQAGP